MPSSVLSTPTDRLTLIAQARHALLEDSIDTGVAPPPAIDAWITRSWQRCLAQGLQPGEPVDFAPLSRAGQRALQERRWPLITAARPVMEQLSRAVAGTGYFGLLTDAQGLVVEVHGEVDARVPAAAAIARVGVDLSESSVGTTAIGAALQELQPVWLHRGEHFFIQNQVYSCAGAPLFGPDGECVGMLDLSGVEVAERPELRHLVARAARQIENRLVLQVPWRCLLRLNWPGTPMDEDAPGETDGLIGLDPDGRILAVNRAACQLLPQLLPPAGAALLAGDLFALPWTTLYDQARRLAPPFELPLWSGLHLQALPRLRASLLETPASAGQSGRPLKDLETALIRKAVDEARGNVAEAAQRLGISRATVYRKLGRPR